MKYSPLSACTVHVRVPAVNLKKKVCTKNNIPLDACKCNIAIINFILDKKITQPLNKYSDIFNFNKNVRYYYQKWKLLY